MIKNITVEALRDPNYNYGGQHVGLPNNPIKVTHVPSGISAICGTERSQHKNRLIALEMVEFGLISASIDFEKED